MGCEYAFRKDNGERLYCGLSVIGHYCIYSKFCHKENRYVFNEDYWKECYLMVQEKQKNVPNGSNFIITKRPCKRGGLYLYVTMGDKAEKVYTKLDKIDQSYVYIKDGVVSLIPFTEEKEKRSRKRKVKDEEQLEN